MFSISTNEKVIGKPPIIKDDHAYREYYRMVNSNFRNKEYSADDLIESISSGYAYSAQLHAGYRHTRNYKKSQLIAFDLDNTGTPIEDIEDSLIINHANFLHTTHSDTTENPRGRAVFLLENPITNSNLYGMVVRAMMRYARIAVDEVCKDSVRIFFGNKDCRVRRLGNVFGTVEMFTLLRPYLEEIKEDDKHLVKARGSIDVKSLNGVADLTLKREMNKIIDPLYTCSDKHATLVKISCLVGGYVPHYISMESAFTILETAISTRDIRSLSGARSTIRAGLTHGTKTPVKLNPQSYTSIYDFIGE